MTNIENIAELCNRYEKWRSEKLSVFEEDFEEPSELRDVEKKREECNKLANELSDMLYSFEKEYIKENSSLNTSDKNNLEKYILLSRTHLSRINYKYLHRLDSIYSEITQEQSKERDLFVLLISILVSLFIGLAITYCFDRENDKDINEIQNRLKELTSKMQEINVTIDDETKIIKDSIGNSKNKILKEIKVLKNLNAAPN